VMMEIMSPPGRRLPDESDEGNGSNRSNRDDDTGHDQQNLGHGQADRLRRRAISAPTRTTSK
jgi:hypothetical protein